VPGADVTANVFDILRVPPLLVRTFVEGDEQVGGPDVVVIGYDLWRRRFDADPTVVGQSVPVSGRPHTVVGVMPEGFTFPSREELWIPLRELPLPGPTESAEVSIFGRLTDGVSEAEAHAEVGGLGQRMSAAFPDARAGLRAEVVPFGLSIVQLPRRSFVTIPELSVVQLVALLLLVVACANVGILQLAKAATRFKEIAVRTALGASRRRILTQMFAESLVLSLAATGIGLAAFGLVYRWLAPTVTAAAGGGLPYWLDLGMTWDVALVALGLAAVCAFITGVLPALKVTGGEIQRALQRLNGHRSGIRFGGVTTALIALDVAVTVVAVGFGSLVGARLLDGDRRAALTGFPAEEYLAARIDLAPGGRGVVELDYSAEADERLGRAQEAIVERLGAEPGVHGLAAANVLPRMEHPDREMEWADDASAGDVHRRRLAAVQVAPSFFDALGQPILLGRGFEAADLREGITPVIVNAAFVEAGLADGNPLGRRVRFVSDADTIESQWYEIVGVVGPLGVNIMSDDGGEAIYVPTAVADIRPLRLGLLIGSSPEAFIPRLRAIVNEVDPLATVADPRALSRFWPADWYLELLVLGVLLVGLVGVLVSLGVSALYAVMSFAVTERAREIGIRTALGAERRPLALLVARRALGQIGAGVALGTPWVVWMFLRMRGYSGIELSGGSLVVAALLPGIGVTALVGFLGCTVPTLRALRIDPNEVLKAEG
jgi:predicted permease